MPDNKTLAIFAGRGNLPQMLIRDCEKKKRKFKVFLLESESYEIDYSKYNPTILPYGKIGEFVRILKEHNIKELVLVGAVNKPDFSTLKVDKETAFLLAKILANKVLGDNAVLGTVMNFLKKQGLKLLAIEDLLDCVVSKKGVITKLKPNKEDEKNIEIGQKAIAKFSAFDVGQSIVVSQKQIIAVEAVEGTDEMIKRCKNLEIDYKDQAILIKMKKKGQNKKVDLPTIGVNTIKNCHKSGIKGIAIQANSTLVLDKEKVIETANELGLFIAVI